MTRPARQMSHFQNKFAVVLFLFGVGTLFAQDSSFTDWDSLMADVLVIRQLTDHDSVKNSEIRALFQTAGITIEQYRDFYRHLHSRSAKEQQAFVDTVKAIIVQRDRKRIFQTSRQYKGSQTDNP